MSASPLQLACLLLVTLLARFANLASVQVIVDFTIYSFRFFTVFINSVYKQRFIIILFDIYDLHNILYGTMSVKDIIRYNLFLYLMMAFKWY